MNYFYDRTKAIFFGEDVRLTEYYIGCHSVGKIWNTLILVDNNVFVLQATQSFNSPNLEASRLQVHFLQRVKLPCFRRRRILTEHRLLKFDCVVQKNWKGNFKVFTLNV